MWVQILVVGHVIVSLINWWFISKSKTIPQFDLLLLGMGPDGHTCSLFPEHPLLDETARLIAPISDSPKPPPERVTMTYPLINNAKVCLFAMSGEGKAAMVKVSWIVRMHAKSQLISSIRFDLHLQRILVDGEKLPAGQVRPTAGKLVWLLDQSAASLLWTNAVLRLSCNESTKAFQLWLHLQSCICRCRWLDSNE